MTTSTLVSKKSSISLRSKKIDMNTSASTNTAILSHERVAEIRRDFPILRKLIHDKPLIFFDSAASAQKPQIVIDRMSYFYQNEYSNVHRGIHTLSQEATSAYEMARTTAARLLNASSENEIIFTAGTTAGINLVSATWGLQNLKSGDEILITEMEHHANIVPWQLLCEKTGAILKAIPLNDRGELIMEEAERLLTEKVKLLAIVHISNALGTINPVVELTNLAHQVGAVVLVDGAQSTAHMSVDVQATDCDFFVTSGHKMFGPTGTGILYGKAHILNDMPPYQGGGDMIDRVTLQKSTYAAPPSRFEAGTPNIAGFVGLDAAIKYLDNIGRGAIAAYEHELLLHATEVLQGIPGLEIVGTAKRKASVLSFVMNGIHPFDIGTILDQQGIAVRTGHHCAQPVMDRFRVPATTRASLAFYNTHEEIEALGAALRLCNKYLG